MGFLRISRRKARVGSGSKAVCEFLRLKISGIMDRAQGLQKISI